MSASWSTKGQVLKAFVLVVTRKCFLVVVPGEYWCVEAGYASHRERPGGTRRKESDRPNRSQPATCPLICIRVQAARK